MRIGQVKNATKFSIFTEIQLVFLNKFSLDCCKTLTNFQSSKKRLILTSFSQCSYCFF